MSHGKEGVVKRGPGRPPKHPHASQFAFKTGDLVLVKWHDGMVYFAKIKRIDHKRHKCAVVFDDKSQDEAQFSQIHSVDETTTDIICIRCKKDDSDKPNEIVLCDTCGIGFHQKCHVPNIPASALELDTPWNCVYCLKGVKCPFLTESLDVLQNLLSDDEEASTADNTESTTAAAGVGTEGDQVNHVAQPTPKKKRGRKPAHLSSDMTPPPSKRERRKIHSNLHPHQSSSYTSVAPLDASRGAVSEGWRPPKTYANEDSDSEVTYLSSGKSTPEPPSRDFVGKKRKRHHVGGQVKKQKRSSVESRTVSVTRVSAPICDTSSAEEMDTSRDSSVIDDTTPVTNHVMPTIKEGTSASHQKRPRSLRVSLSIPEDVEPGTPFDKVVKAHHQKVNSPHVNVESKELPSWENFASANVLKASSPKERPQTLPTDKSSSIFHSKKNSTVASLTKSTPSTATSSSLKTSPVSSQSSAPAFLASPLPISSSPSPKILPPASLTSPTLNLKTKPTSSSPDVGTGGSTTPANSNSQPAAVGYSTPLPSSASTGVQASSSPSALVVRITQTEGSKGQPQVVPPERKLGKPAEHCGKPSQPSMLQKPALKPALPATTEGAPGITQPSTNHALSLPTKATTLPTVTAAVSSERERPAQGQQSPAGKELPSNPPPNPPRSTVEPTKVVRTAPVARGAVVRPPHAQQVAIPTQSHIQTVPSAVSARPVIVSTLPTQPPVSQGTQTAVQPPKINTTLLQNNPLRPSSVPIFQQAQVQTQPPRPSSVPTQSQPKQQQRVSTPLSDHVIVTKQVPRSTTSPVQRNVVVSHPQPNIVRLPKTGPQPLSGVQVSPVPLQGQRVSVATPVVSTVPTISNVAIGSPATLQTARPHVQQQQSVPATTATTVKQSSGDADVIITGVEAKTEVIQGPSVGYERPSAGGKVVLVSQASHPPTTSIAALHHTAAVAGGGTRKVTAKPVDVQQMASPVNPPQAVTSLVGGSHTPVSVVPVVITTPASTPSTQILYHLPNQQTPPMHAVAPPAHAVAPPPPAQVIREARPVRTPPLRSAAVTRSSASSATSVIVATPSSIVHSSSSPPNAVVYSTTKPYAVVNAMPGQIYYTASQAVHPSQADAITLPAGSLPHPPKTYSTVEKQRVSSKQHTSDVVQKISKKIGDAFDNGDEKALMAAFDDAWKRFQANGTEYERSVRPQTTKVVPSGKEPPPPNAEVCSGPGMPSRVNLVRQISGGIGRPRLLPKTLPAPVQVQNVISPPPLSSHQGQSNYIYTAADAAGQPQVYLQPVSMGSASPTGQQHPKVLSTGLFYPPSGGTKAVPVSTQGIQRVVVSQAVPVVRKSTISSSNSNTSVSDKTQQTQVSQKRRSSKSKYCSRCGKSATYLCSGCHLEWYCGRDCQLKAWDTHAEHCKA